MLWVWWEAEEALHVWGNLVGNGAQRRGSVHGAVQPPSGGMEEAWAWHSPERLHELKQGDVTVKLVTQRNALMGT